VGSFERKKEKWETHMETLFVNDIVAAKLLSSSPKTLRNWRHLGRGPAYSKRGRMVRYRVQDLLDFMASGRIDPEGRIKDYIEKAEVMIKKGAMI